MMMETQFPTSHLYQSPPPKTPQSPQDSRSPQWAEEFRQLDCKHCSHITAAKPDGALMENARDLERQAMHEQIKIEMQRLITMEGAQMV